MPESVDIDALDAKIINKLQEDGRKSFRKIAEDIGSTPATVINRVDKLKEAGVIRGYRADIDFQRLGYQAIAAIEIMVKGDSITEIEELMQDHDNVVSAFSITGDSDILLLVKFKARKELSEFVKTHLVGSDTVQKTVTHMTLDIIKEHQNPPLDVPEE